MIIQEIDGEERQYILRYNRLDIDISTYKEAVEITPNVEYWKDKIELEEVNERFSDVCLQTKVDWGQSKLSHSFNT